MHKVFHLACHRFVNVHIVASGCRVLQLQCQHAATNTTAERPPPDAVGCGRTIGGPIRLVVFTLRGGLSRLAAWHLPGWPVGPASRWAAMSNVEVDQMTYPVNGEV